jgi:hypothetical protein
MAATLQAQTCEFRRPAADRLTNGKSAAAHLPLLNGTSEPARAANAQKSITRRTGELSMHNDAKVIHISMPDSCGSAVVRGRTYYWDFHNYLGPTFTKKDGTVLKNQPSEHHPVWGPFAEWLKKYEAERAAARASLRR